MQKLNTSMAPRGQNKNESSPIFDNVSLKQGIGSVLKLNLHLFLNAGVKNIDNMNCKVLQCSLPIKFPSQESWGGSLSLPFLHLSAPPMQRFFFHDFVSQFPLLLKEKLEKQRIHNRSFQSDVCHFFQGAGMKVETGVRKITDLRGMVDRVQNRLRILEASSSFEPDVHLSSWEPQTGDTLVILVTIPPPRGIIDRLQLALVRHFGKEPLVEINYHGNKMPVYPLVSDPATWRALVASTPLDKESVHKLLVQVRDGRHRLYERQVLLREREYPVESIWLPKEKVGLKGTESELKAVKEFRSRQTEEQHWNLPLAVPNNGEVTTEYGLKRYYNGVFAEGYFHRGIDYGADVGDPVVAPAGGRVTLVGREEEGFALHGNCVGLDHGQGVMSLLLHLNSIQVREGAMVKAGELVGTVGSTGMSTGPHLHWGLYVNGECIDPKVWMEPQAWS